MKSCKAPWSRQRYVSLMDESCTKTLYIMRLSLRAWSEVGLIAADFLELGRSRVCAQRDAVQCGALKIGNNRVVFSVDSMVILLLVVATTKVTSLFLLVGQA